MVKIMKIKAMRPLKSLGAPGEVSPPPLSEPGKMNHTLLKTWLRQGT